MNDYRKIIYDKNKKAYLIGFFQYALEDVAEALAVIELEDGTIRDHVSPSDIKFEEWTS